VWEEIKWQSFPKFYRFYTPNSRGKNSNTTAEVTRTNEWNLQFPIGDIKTERKETQSKTIEEPILI
jgi:hypothetical protein